MQIFLMIVGGFAAGFLSGLLGVGGGLLFVPILVYLFQMNMHQAIGTSLAIIIPTSIVGALRHFAGQSVDLRVAVGVSLFAILGAFAGAHLSLLLPTVLLRKMFALFLFCLSLHMFFQK